jgi:hypothetical protein
LKQQQIILGSITATLSALALGYFGVQYFEKTTMYTVAGAMLGLGATSQVTQFKSKSKFQPSKQSPPPSFPLTPVIPDSPQPTQPNSQSIEQKIEHHITPVIQDAPQPIQLNSQSIEQKIEHHIHPAIQDSPQPIQPNSQQITQKTEHQIEIIESDSSKVLIAEIDPIIERFVTLGLDEF